MGPIILDHTLVSPDIVFVFLTAVILFGVAANTSLRDVSRKKGNLLLEESEEDMMKRHRRTVSTSKYLAVYLVVFVISLDLLLLYFWGAGLLFWSVSALILPLTLLGVLALLREAERLRPRPMRIYENGIESPATGIAAFYSFGEMSGVKETGTLYGQVYTFYPGNEIPSRYVQLNKDMKGLEELMDTIRSRIGDPEYLVLVPLAEEDIPAAKRNELSIYLFIFLLAIIPTAFLLLALFTRIVPFSYPLLGLLLVFPQMLAGVLALAVYGLKDSKTAPPKLNIKVPFVLITVLLALFLLMFSSKDAIIAEAVLPFENISSKPEMSFLAPGTYENENLTIDGDILVDSGELLSLNNSVISMNLSSDGQFGIWVAEGGELRMSRSVIRSTSDDLAYTFEIMGHALIVESDISGLWGDTEHTTLNGGLEVYSSDVWVFKSHIHDTRTNGLMIMNSNPLVESSLIEGANDDGIEMQNSGARIINNTITNCEWAMVASRRSDAYIGWNNISGNRNGIGVSLISDPVIESNHFEKNTYRALWVSDDSNPSCTDNTYSMNGEEFERGSSFYYPDICSNVGILVAIFSFTLLFLAYYLNRFRYRKVMEDLR